MMRLALEASMATRTGMDYFMGLSLFSFFGLLEMMAERNEKRMKR